VLGLGFIVLEAATMNTFLPYVARLGGHCNFAKAWPEKGADMNAAVGSRELKPSGIGACFKIMAIMLFSLTASMASAGDPNPGLSPFVKLDSDLRRYIAIENKALASKQGEAKARQTLEVLYYYLHDIRSHRAFWELWNQVHWKKETLRVLYPGSGSHLAPLVFLYGPSHLKEVFYTFTEVDQSSPVRIEALLRTMERGKMCSGVSVQMAPIQHAGFNERWAQAMASNEAKLLSSYPEAFIPWYIATVKELKESPGFEADFQFWVGATHAHIKMLISVHKDEQAGSTSYYQQRDFNAADLVVTHDWDSSPRTNLEVLFDLLNSSRIAARKKPLFVMMEDLRRYPFPVDLALFNPLAASATPYGHCQHVVLPDGSRLESEDGPSLYEGGVLLSPDLGVFNSLSPLQMETLFNLILFSGQMYDRGNVDIIDSCLVTAPPLLDLGVGYGYRDIWGRDLREDGQFPSKLVEGSVNLLQSRLFDSKRMKEDLCHLVFQLARTLKEQSDRDIKALLDQWTADQSEHPFLRDPKTRQKFAEIYAERTSVAAQVERDSMAFKQALEVWEQKRGQAKDACGQ
jgi:hypothetical protein